ncbi:MAG: TIGR03790 family protein [Candidatus Brocadiaceae bacterium]|nr:TIGR03790 family protein [Candidatus Brocadiaceae bacterium]
MQESKDVAQYYCSKRGVPVSNLVGVDVPESENILRPDYESKIIPPIRRIVNNLRLSGNDPAVLLVYGVPLRIKETEKIKHYKQYEDLADSKVKEYKKLIQQQGRHLEKLIDQGVATTPNYEWQNIESISTSEIIKSINRTVTKASGYLKNYTPTALNQETYLRTVSLLFRITGMSPMVKDIRSQILSLDEKERSIFLRVNNLLKYNAILNKQLTELQFFGFTPKKALEVSTIIRMVNGVIGELLFWDAQQKKEIGEMASASVDSELTLVLTANHQHSKWLLNPFLITHDKLPGIEMIRRKIVMVGRLDAPSPVIAKRMVDDALETERVGLTGTFYIDARGLDNANKKDSYQLYDEHLRNLYKIVKSKSTLPVVLDDNPKLFPEKSCPDAALYAGWYSLAKYVDSFEWKKGAVGLHIASSEASTLKRHNSQVWCKRLIEEGVTATLGPVNEPYLSAFPLPDVFFPLLMEGKRTLLEVYFKSIPHISWRMILIGDPLYTPFKNNPGIKLTPLEQRNDDGT